MQKGQPKIIQTTNVGVKQIKTILHWLHQEGGEAHCLVRHIYYKVYKNIALINSIDLDQSFHPR